ncbi:MAG: hypothetical protein AAFQ75_07510 [Pseudomonadota bacterium]
MPGDVPTPFKKSLDEVVALAAGDTAMMMLEKGPDGLYGIRALIPAE